MLANATRAQEQYGRPAYPSEEGSGDRRVARSEVSSMQLIRARRGFGLYPVLLSLAILGILVDSPGHAATGAANPTTGDIKVAPTSFQLRGRRANQQMLATNRGPDGSISDATRSVEWLVSDPRIASISPRGRVVPLRNGT